MVLRRTLHRDDAVAAIVLILSLLASTVALHPGL